MKFDDIHKNIVLKTDLGCLYKDDCLNVLDVMGDNTVDCVFLDPPFNLSKNYNNGRVDDMEEKEYLRWSYRWIDECIRVLRPGGTMLLYNIPKWCAYYSVYLMEKLIFKNWIAVDMKTGMTIKNRYSAAHYGLLYFVKRGEGVVFNKQRVPIQTCRFCGGEFKDYGGHKNKLNPNGIGVSDVWFDIYPVRRNKHREMNELSVKFMTRIIQCHTNPGDIILDPFGGAGTTFSVAEILNRRWIGIEIGDCEVIANRINQNTDDRKEVEKIMQNTGLFSKEAKKVRMKIGFWLG